MSGPPPAYHPTDTFYTESQPQQYNQFQGPTYSQPQQQWNQPPPQQIYAPQPYVQQPQPQTIIITDQNNCRDNRNMSDEECCCLALAGACCLACLATNN